MGLERGDWGLGARSEGVHGPGGQARPGVRALLLALLIPQGSEAEGPGGLHRAGRVVRG